MAANVYPVFRDYSLAIKSWLIDLFNLPRFDRIKYNIVSMTRSGTTDGGVNQHEIQIDVNMLLLSSDAQFKAGHVVKVSGTTANDEQYLIKNISQSGDILILDENYRKIRSEQPNSMGSIKRSLNIVYANFQRSVATIAQPLRNGTIDTPGVSFFVNDFQYKIEKSRPRENYYTRKYKDNNSGAIIGVAAVPPLQEYELHYTVNIWAVYQQEMDILLYQIMSEFAPEKYFWIGESAYGFDYSKDRMDRENHGQWAHALMESMSNVSELEPGDAQDRTIRYEISFTIDNAFIPLPFDDNQSMIGALNIEMENLADFDQRL